MTRLPLLLSILCVVVTQLGVNIYMPALPAMAQDLALSEIQVQQVITLYLLAFGTSQLLYGPLSDAIGRRPIFLFGIVISMLGAALCIWGKAQVPLIMAGRVLQGLGAGGCIIISRALLRDCYQGQALLSAVTVMSIMAAAMPMIAPPLGGWVTEFFGWPALFSGVLAALTLIFALGWFSLKETHRGERASLRPSHILADYWWLLRQPQFTCNASYGWVTFLMWMVALSAMPFLLQRELGVGVAEYGQLMSLPPIGFILGGITASRLKNHFDSLQLIAVSVVLLLLCAIWLLFSPLQVSHLIGHLILLSFAAGLATPAAMMRMMEPFKAQAGRVAALSGATQMLLPGILGGVLAPYFAADHRLLGVFYLILCGGLWLSIHIQKQHIAPAGSCNAVH